jgi:hypothetical protein
MSCRRFTVFATALAVVTLSAIALSSSADARRGGGGGRPAAGAHASGQTGGRRTSIGRVSARPAYVHSAGRASWRTVRPVKAARRHHRRVHVAAPVISRPYSDDECRWLKRRAQRSGKPVWWRRYWACLEGYPS